MSSRLARMATVIAVVAVLGPMSASTESPVEGRVHVGGAPPAIAGVAMTPPLGWDSYNTFGCNIDEQLVEREADAMVDSGMRSAGYRYVVVDDCWFDPQRAADGRLRGDPERFPSGMAALARYIHERGLEFGIYESPGVQTCAQRSAAYPGSTGSAGHEQLDASTFAEWGVDYLKYDWCAPGTDVAQQVSAFARMRDAIRATHRPMVYSINPNSGVAATPPGQRYDWSGVASMARLTNDAAAAWQTGEGEVGDQGVREIIAAVAAVSPESGRGHWFDPDMLEIGVPGVPGSAAPGLARAEERTEFAMWAMMSAPMIAGNDLTDMSAEVRNLLTQRDVLAIDQDELGIAGKSTRDPNVWMKPLSDGSVAVAMYNPADSARRMTIGPDDLPIAKERLAIRNVWDGTRPKPVGSLSAQVMPHDTTLLVVKSE